MWHRTAHGPAVLRPQANSMHLKPHPAPAVDSLAARVERHLLYSVGVAPDEASTRDLMRITVVTLTEHKQYLEHYEMYYCHNLPQEDIKLLNYFFAERQ